MVHDGTSGQGPKGRFAPNSEALTVGGSLKARVAGRLASCSWQGALVAAVLGGALGGANFVRPQDVSAPQMMGAAALGAVIAALYGALAIRMRLSPIWSLPRPARQQVIDAVRFGGSIEAPSLAGPLLSYTAKLSRRVRPSAIIVGTAVLALTSVIAGFVAFRAARVGWAFDATTYGVATVGCAGLAALWPEFGRACRRNIAAAEHAARAVQSSPPSLIRAATG